MKKIAEYFIIGALSVLLLLFIGAVFYAIYAGIKCAVDNPDRAWPIILFLIMLPFLGWGTKKLIKRYL